MILDPIGIFELLAHLATIVVAYAAMYAFLLYRKDKRGDRARFTIELLVQERYLRIAMPDFSRSAKFYSERIEKIKQTEGHEELSPKGERKVSQLHNLMPIDQFLDTLAVMEMLGLGIRKNILDDNISYEYIGSVFVKRYKDLKPFIYAMREEDTPTSFSDLEALAQRWMRRDPGDVS